MWRLKAPSPIFAPITKVHNLLSKKVIDGVFLTFEGIKNFKLGKLVVVQVLAVAIRATVDLQASEFCVLEFGSFYRAEQRESP